MREILVIDDDSALAELIGTYLSSRNFNVQVCNNGSEGLSLLREKTSSFDMIILDVMMPEMDGFEVLRDLRSFSSTPVIMLTARGDEMDRIVGLEMGADDYMPKPFNPRELEARIKAIFRRSASNENPNTPADTSIIVNGELKINTSTREIFVSDNKVETTTTEYEILRVLMEHKGKVVDREQLMKMARGQEWMAYDRSVDVHISNLRKKLGSAHLIKTIHGVGYLTPLA